MERNKCENVEGIKSVALSQKKIADKTLSSTITMVSTNFQLPRHKHIQFEWSENYENQQKQEQQEEQNEQSLMATVAAKDKTKEKLNKQKMYNLVKDNARNMESNNHIKITSNELRRRLTQGCTSLMHACQQGHIETIIHELRTKPETVNQRDRSNKSVLHYCTGQRDLVAAASVAIAAPELLESADEDGFTPLHLAVIQGNLAMVNLLLANKADVNVVDNEGHSVVHWATVCGEVEALRSILLSGANVTTPDINGGSPLHYAAQMCGANYEGKLGQPSSTKLALEILDILLSHPHSTVDVIDKDGRQPLLWAASAGSAKAVMSLVKAGARVECADKDGLTALHCAASRGHTECIDTLISLCGAPTDLIDSNGCTALHYAVTLGHADATSRLLDLEADPNRQDRKGRTPAHCGCSKGQFETVKLLKERGANLWLRNAKGDLPVHEAASSGRRELVEWLLEQRSKQVNTTSNDGRSLLHIAATNNFTDMCKMLIDYGADINCIHRNPKGVVITPLDCALQKGHRSTAKFLQANGGLPASKLRLSARRPSAFNDQELVKPMKFIEKEELHDIQNSKKYVVYLRKSDSDSAAECSCTEHSGKSEKKTEHVCRQHRKKFRRRTSSCGEADYIEKDDSCSDICRSKSNIEIHRRKSKEKFDSSGEDSCENCCRHKRKQRLKRKERQRRKSRERMEDDDMLEDDKRDKKIATDDKDKEKSSRPSSITSSKRPQSARTPRQIKEATFIKTPPNGRESIEKDVQFDMTDEETAPKPEQVVTRVDVHQTQDSLEQPIVEESSTTTKKDEDFQERIEETIAKEVNDVLEAAAAVATVASPENDEITKSLLEPSEIAEEGTKIEENAKTEGTANIMDKETCNDTTEQKENETDVALSEKYNVVTQKDSINPNIPLEVVVNEQTECKQEMQIDSVAEDMEKAADTKENSRETQQAGDDLIKDVASDKKISEDMVPVAKEDDKNKGSDDGYGESAIRETANTQLIREHETRRSFTLLPDSPDDKNGTRKSSFTVLKSDESLDVDEAMENLATNDDQPFEIVPDVPPTKAVSDGEEYSSEEGEQHDGDEIEKTISDRHSIQGMSSYDYSNGRKRRLKKRIKSGSKTRTWRGEAHGSKDQDSGFEPSPRAMRTKIPSPRNIYTAYMPRKPTYATLDHRSCSSRLENRKLGDRSSCDMSAVTRSIQRNIRRYYMERKIFQHLLELKSLQIRSSKLNESVLVKRAVDDYHKSCIALGAETGGTLRRYPYTEYTFKNFELFLYDTLKSLQRPGTYNFQNINDVYEEAERRLSPDYNAYEKALHCTTKTHRCHHAAHAYTGIPCAAYIPMMNHHTMPKFGFGPYKKTGVGSFYLPKILTGQSKASGSRVSLEVSHGKSKQLISLPSDKLDSNKRYYVTFTVKESSKHQIDTDGTKGPAQHSPEEKSTKSDAASNLDNK